MFTQAFDTVLELALLGLFLGVSGYAARLIFTTVRGDHALGPEANGHRQNETPAPHEEAPGPD